jgi:hypothetical protein
MPAPHQVSQNCVFFCDPPKAAEYEYEFWNKIANHLNKNIVILCNRLARNYNAFVPALESFVEETNFKPDLVLIHTAFEPCLLTTEALPPTAMNKHFLNALEKIYDRLPYPKAILSSDPFFKNNSHEKFNVINYELFYFYVFNNIKQTAIPHKKEHKLSCLNRSARPGRVHLFTKLVNQEYFRDIHYSFLNMYMIKTPRNFLMYANRPQNKRAYEYLFPLNMVLDKDECDRTTKVFLENWDSFPIKIDDFMMYDDCNLTMVDAYTNSVCNLSTETFPVIYPFITEKTFKPISIGMPFFVHASAGSIEYLRSLGFDVYDDVIDHSYDNETDYLTRTNMLLDSVKKFMQSDYKRDRSREDFNSRQFYSEETYYKFYTPLIVELKKILKTSH